MLKKLTTLFALVSLALTCGTTDETISGIKSGAVIFEPGGKTPAVGATVKVFKASSTNGVYASLQITDASGNYSLSGLAADTYNILAEKDSLVTFQGSVSISANSTTVQNDTLECASSLTGTVGVEPNHDPRTVTIQVVGTDKFFNNTDINGRFTMKGMASGNYTLLMNSTLEGYTPTTKEVTVNHCSNDTLRDTLPMIYTGIPVVTGLAATYDTVSGTVHLHWNKTEYRDFQEYIIFRDSCNAVTPSANPIAFIGDTSFVDKIHFTSGDAQSSLCLKYRVAIRNNSGTPGETYKNVSIIAVQPTLAATSFQIESYHMAKGFITDSASINDSIRFIAKANNPTRCLRSISWTDQTGKLLRTKALDTNKKSGADSLFQCWKNIGTDTLICKVVDMVGMVWRDTIGFKIVTDAPVVHLSAPKQVTLGDSIHLHAVFSDYFGKVVKIEWDIGNSGSFKTSTVPDTLIIAPNSPIPNFSCTIRVTDDDGIVSTDVVSILLSSFIRATDSAAFGGRVYHAGLVYNNKMWIIGGNTSAFGYLPANDVWYSNNGSDWTEATNAAEFSCRINPTALVFNNSMWIIGGTSSSGFALNDVWYSSDGNHWTQATASAAFGSRTEFASMVFKDKMWIIGGYDKNNNAKNDVWYSSDGITWTEATNSAAFSPRGGASGFVYDSKMWIIGGGTAQINEIWNSIDGISWNKVATSPNFTAGFGIVNGNKIWVINQSAPYGNLQYSSDGISWTQIPPPMGFPLRIGCSVVSFDNNLWVIGGDAGLDPNSQFGMHFLLSDVWHSK